MKKVTIIAEAGVNHNGNIDLAKKLVDVATESGADYVKFQTADLNSIVSAQAEMSEYQKKNTGKTESQKEMLRGLLLTYSDFEKIYEYCGKKKISFLSTPFDINSIDFLKQFNMPFWKVPSGEITNYPYLVHIAETAKPVVMSCGMSDLTEIQEAIELLKKNGTPQITVLHCNTDYPTEMIDVNLRAMNWLKDKLNVPVGYSDHTMGIEVPVAAVARGASVIEKHFTLDRSMKGPDHICSLEPKELKQMIQCIRNIEQALGRDVKYVTNSEKNNIAVVRKSIVCAVEIKEGDVISENMITSKRPGIGIIPMKWNQVIGKRANRDYHVDELLDGCILNEKKNSGTYN